MKIQSECFVWKMRKLCDFSEMRLSQGKQRQQQDQKRDNESEWLREIPLWLEQKRDRMVKGSRVVMKVGEKKEEDRGER